MRTALIFASVLVGLGLFGFPVTEKLKLDAVGNDPVELFFSHWWALTYIYAYPLAIGILTLFLDTSGTLTKVSYLVLFLSNLQSVLHIGNEIIQPFMDRLGMSNLYWSPAAFGVRGTLIAVATGVSIGFVVVDNPTPSRSYHYLSLCFFALAAWQTCGLASFGAWAAHPEFGDNGHHVRDQMATVQFFFLGGFATAAVAHYKDHTKAKIH